MHVYYFDLLYATIVVSVVWLTVVAICWSNFHKGINWLAVFAWFLVTDAVVMFWISVYFFLEWLRTWVQLH